MERRTVVIGALGMLAALFRSVAQAQKPRRIALLYVGSRQSAAETGRYAAFMQGMKEAGYLEGRDFEMKVVYADGDAARFSALARDVVNAKPDVIISTATPMHAAFRKATASIPIVMTVAADPVRQGIATSLSRPGGNITGITSVNAELSRKYFEILSDTVPSVSRIGILHTSSNPSHAEQVGNLRVAIAKSGKLAHAVDVRTPNDVERAVAGILADGANAIIIVADGLFVEQARKLAELAVRHRVPVMYPTSEHPEAGGLMSYGPDIRDNYRRAAHYVDRIFKGARPGDLPIEQPSKFEFVINLKSARAIGLSIPKSILFRADKLIE